MAEEDHRLELVERFLNGTGPSYDFMVHAATLGIDRLWKQAIVNRIPAHASRILDLACGTGISTLAIARRFPGAKVIGVELREEYLAMGRKKFERLGIANVEFVRSRAEDYRSGEPFDAVVSSYLAKYADLERLTASSKSMLRSEGLLLMHDFTFPPNGYLVATWRVYFWLLQRIGSPFFASWREIFYGLPRLIEETRWVEELQGKLAAQGFHEIKREDLTLYGSAIVTARK